MELNNSSDQFILVRERKEETIQYLHSNNIQTADTTLLKTCLGYTI